MGLVVGLDGKPATQEPAPKPKAPERQGPFNISYSIDTRKGKVVIKFSEPITELEFTPGRAKLFADNMKLRALKLKGQAKSAL